MASAAAAGEKNRSERKRSAKVRSSLSLLFPPLPSPQEKELTEPQDPEHSDDSKLKFELSKSEAWSDEGENETGGGGGGEKEGTVRSVGGFTFRRDGFRVLNGTDTNGTTRTKVQTVRKMMYARMPPTTEVQKGGGERSGREGNGSAGGEAGSEVLLA